MLLTALGMIEMGTTGVVDVSQVNNTPEHSDALIRALQDSGIRAVFGYSDGKGPGVQYPQDIFRLQRSYFSSKDLLLTLALGAGPDPKMFALAREVGVPIIVHVRNVLPQRNDGDKLLQLSRAELLRPGDEYIHCLHFPGDTWHLIKDNGGRVSLSPPIEMMRHGTPAIQEALDNGVRPSLSSDHAVTLSSDFFTLMRSTAIAQRYFVLQRGRNGDRNLPPLLTCREGP
jgi:cytosine/adenosine deaminase-related metal-dependent hydrolase